MVVFGTRPEAIKMCPLVKVLKDRKNVETIVCVTAQHREMLDQVLEIFDVEPNFDLNIMKQGQSLSSITTNILTELEPIIKEVKPDIMLVHGDTTTTFAASLVAFYNGVMVGHVEAGLRTYNKHSPFPEEMNRQMTGVIADMHFAPTLTSKKNLLRESKDENSIYVTGNTAIDALKTTVKSDYSNEYLDWANDSKLIMLTAHRRENLGEKMEAIFKGIKKVIDEFPEYKVIYPVHLNPTVRSSANKVFGDSKRVKLIEPLDVINFHNMLAKSEIILTDSGGIQEEAPSLGKPVLVLRDTTERPEGVEAGTLKLVGTDEEIVYQTLKELIVNKSLYKKMSRASNPYGDGYASERIVDAIEQMFEI
jgi:UDP-N-acetylglucosamine 2-epimerase (non-hydrolysing)